MREILIGADIVPTKRNYNLFRTGNKNELLGKELCKRIEHSDYRIFNLEVPLTDTENPIEKCGPHLSAPTNMIVGFKALNIDLFTLANNHIFDQGVFGLDSTIKTLEQADIQHIGAGKNIQEAEKAYIFTFIEKKIGIYACAEHEFSIATSLLPGANPFDPLYSLEHISDLKKQCDYGIVLYHGGKEQYRYPSPELQKRCHRLVEKGADFVVCQHSHCIGCEEHYNKGTIVYGQGNFIFDDSDAEEWQTGLLISIDEKFHISYIPLRKTNETVRIAEGEDGDNILLDFQLRSKEIEVPGFIEEQYGLFATKMLKTYLEACYGSKSLFFRIMDRISRRGFGQKILNQKYNKKSLIELINYIECEAHLELFLRGMKERSLLL